MYKENKESGDYYLQPNNYYLQNFLDFFGILTASKAKLKYFVNE
jgi:hypothetical protein